MFPIFLDDYVFLFMAVILALTIVIVTCFVSGVNKLQRTKKDAAWQNPAGFENMFKPPVNRGGSERILDYRQFEDRQGDWLARQIADEKKKMQSQK